MGSFPPLPALRHCSVKMYQFELWPPYCHNEANTNRPLEDDCAPDIAETLNPTWKWPFPHTSPHSFHPLQISVLLLMSPGRQTRPQLRTAVLSQRFGYIKIWRADNSDYKNICYEPLVSPWESTKQPNALDDRGDRACGESAGPGEIMGMQRLDWPGWRVSGNP